MGLAGLQAKETRRLFHPAEVEVTLEAVQRAPKRSEVERWLAARDGNLGEEKTEGEERVITQPFENAFMKILLMSGLRNKIVKRVSPV